MTRISSRGSAFHFRRALVATFLALTVSGVGIVDAAQTTRVTTTPQLPATLTPATPIEAKVKLGDKFSSLDRVCVTLHFETDLLDPGDVVAVEFIGGMGVNPGAPSQDQRTVCTVDPSALELWLDGKQNVGIFADAGTSVTISALEFEAFGTPK